MATAVAYNDWEDPGLAFSDEEVEAFNPQDLGLARVEYLISVWTVAHKRADLQGVEKPVWWKEASRSAYKSAEWYCIALELPGLNKEALLLALPSPQSDRGKKLAKEVLAATPEDWLGAWQANAEACMRYAVTLGRRHAGKSKVKNTKRLANKLANSIQREMNACSRLTTLLESRSN